MFSIDIIKMAQVYPLLNPNCFRFDRMQKGTTCKFASTAVGAKVASFGWVTPYPNPTAIMTNLQSNGPLPSGIKVLNSLYSYA
jgi:hypothetical protein